MFLSYQLPKNLSWYVQKIACKACIDQREVMNWYFLWYIKGYSLSDKDIAILLFITFVAVMQCN